MNTKNEYGIIYKATNLINQKSYIGMTTKSLEERAYSHEKTSNSRNEKFSRLPINKAFKEFGFDSFSWEIIDKADSAEELAQKEIFWIDFYKSYGEFGYNSTMGGLGLKKIWTEEEKLSFGRNQIGSKNNTAKLNEEKVQLIADLIIEGHSQREIARRFNVTFPTIGYIARGDRWSHAIPEEKLQKMKEATLKNTIVPQKEYTKLTDNIVRLIKNDLREGQTHKDLAFKYNVSCSQISSISIGRTWKHVV